MKRNLSAALLLILALAAALPAILSAQAVPQTNEPQANPQAAPAKPAAKAAPEPQILYPAYSSLKEKTAVLVFLVWLWIIVGILVWLLRMKIREADRIHGLKFYPAAKDGSRPHTP